MTLNIMAMGQENIHKRVEYVTTWRNSLLQNVYSSTEESILQGVDSVGL